VYIKQNNNNKKFPRAAHALDIRFDSDMPHPPLLAKASPMESYQEQVLYQQHACIAALGCMRLNVQTNLKIGKGSVSLLSNIKNTTSVSGSIAAVSNNIPSRLHRLSVE
jgi:hypothetical protein